MLTYDFSNKEGPMYDYLYKCIKEDILSGVLKPGEKLPSKRAFASNNGISIITIQNAYDQLISEGYVYTLPKKGYYVSHISGLMSQAPLADNVSYDINIPKEKKFAMDFSGNSCSADNFPFSVWNKLSRQVMSGKKDELMQTAPVCGVRELREAISDYLKSFRGMVLDPDQIIIGAGTEYLYGLLTELFGRDKIYAIEDPGYKKLEQIYGQRNIECRYASLDKNGVTVDELMRTKAEISHICPNHNFPSGITMRASRRYEILSWANEVNGRYIIEDDYDSEFRTEGKPIPTLFSIDSSEKVIYMNTFSKSLTPTIRISYMVLPVHLVNLFYKKMSFYSCTVSNFEQYTLAEFIKGGYFEKHINRMRLFYMRKRKQVMDIINECDLKNKCEIIENDSGLHFIMKLNTQKKDEEIENEMIKNGIRIKALSDYYFTEKSRSRHMFIINYSNIELDNIKEAMHLLSKVV